MPCSRKRKPFGRKFSIICGSYGMNSNDTFQRWTLDSTRDGLSFIRNPFTTDVNRVPEDLQEELLDLKNYFAAQDMYQQSTMEKFWVSTSMTRSYPNLSTHAVRFIVPFASTYMCETGFS